MPMQETAEWKCRGRTRVVSGVHENPELHAALLQVQESWNDQCGAEVCLSVAVTLQSCSSCALLLGHCWLDDRMVIHYSQPLNCAWERGFFLFESTSAEEKFTTARAELDTYRLQDNSQLSWILESRTVANFKIKLDFFVLNKVHFCDSFTEKFSKTPIIRHLAWA